MSKKNNKYNNKNLFRWAWEQRKQGIDPEEARYAMAETVKVLQEFSDPEATEKKVRDYEKDGVVKPYRTEGKHRLFSVSNILCLHLMMQGTKYLGGKKNTVPIVKLYELSRKQPRQQDVMIFDYDPSIPSVAKIHEVLHKPLLKNPIEQVMQLVRVIRKLDTFLHINEFMRKYHFAFICEEKELIEVVRKGKKVKIAPPVIAWNSVKKALDWNNFYYAKMKVEEGSRPKNKKEWDAFDEDVNKKIYDWLKERKLIVALKKRKK